MIVAIVTCYNEASSIKSTLERLIAELKDIGEDFKIIIVDDGSTDGSQKIYSDFASEHEGIAETIRFDKNRGVGAVFRAGLARAVEIAKNDDDMVVIVEADGTNELELIKSMHAEIKHGAQIVVASRYLRGAEVKGVPAHRRILSRLLNVYLRQKFKRFADISDFSYFFKAMSAGAIKRAFEHYKDEFITSSGFCASPEILIKLLSLKMGISELPTKYLYQSRGESKMKVWSTVKEYVSLIRRMGKEIQ